jgi:phenylpropionate dioxygenase-like ring-hydroxylating dioxygenase large terminal subunit
MITGERFVDTAFMVREQTHIWRKTWLLAALESDLQTPKSLVTFDIGRDSIIIARTASGALAAYHNVCTHRGTRLREEGLGEASQIRCPYHAWCFHLDGTLKAAPEPNSFAQGLPAERLRLKPAKVASWKGMVFINMDANAEPLDRFLAPVTKAMAPIDSPSMRLMEDQSAHVDCNWKAIIDNFSELYHVNHIHPQHRRFVDCSAAEEDLLDHGHTGLRLPGFTTDPRFAQPEEATDFQAMQLEALGLNPCDFKGRTPDIPAAIQAAKRAQSGTCGYDYSAFSDVQLTEVFQYNLFPNIILSGSPEGLWVMRSRPHASDPEKSILDKWTLMLEPDPALGGSGDAKQTLHAASDSAPTSTGRAARDVFSYKDVIAGRKSMTDTIDQDLSLLERVQQGAASSGFSSAWLSDQESRVAHFHRAIDAAMSD